MINKWILINIAISVAMFIYIFYYYLGRSGGDMAINILFGFFQILLVIIIPNKSSGTIKYKIILFIILIQIMELIIFLNFGYLINEYLKKEFSPDTARIRSLGYAVNIM
jgi:hypothetical protein